MPFITSAAQDALLNVIKAATAFCVCSREPTSYTEAVLTYLLGQKNTPGITGPTEGVSFNGRKLILPAFTLPAGCSATGTGVSYALVNTSSLTLLLVGDLNPMVDCQIGAALILASDLEIEMPGLSQ